VKAEERTPQRPGLAGNEPGVDVERWSYDAEAKAMRQGEIGLMPPLVDDEWSRGKCACKALQYLSQGRPVGQGLESLSTPSRRNDVLVPPPPTR
jgi:hypothetical protein